MQKLIDIKNFFKIIYSKPQYILLFIVISFAFFALSAWLANYNYIKYVLSSDVFSLVQKFKFSFNFSDLIKISFTTLPLIITITLSLLFGINVSALIFYFKRKIALSRGAKLGTWGSFVGLLGVGCLSCGSVVLSSIFGFTATVAFVGFLPLHGYEFGIFGILALLISIYLLSRKINNNLNCKI